MHKNEKISKDKNPIILSICIPTYNRAEILKRTLKNIIDIDSDEIEIVVSDNASNDNTKSVVEAFKDPRIKYYRNPENLGIDWNIIKCAERAKGRFIFYLSDEDIIELKSILWIIKEVKINQNLTQIIGAIADRREGKKKIYFNPKNRYLNSGHDSLTQVFYATSYISGLVLKRNTLNLKLAERYIGINYMHQVLLIQNLIKGDTICTSKIFCYIAKSSKETKSHIFSTNSDYSKAGLPYNHPLSRIHFVEQNIKLIKEYTFNFPKAQNILLRKQISWAAIYFANLFFLSPHYFTKFLIKFLKSVPIFRKPSFFLLFLRLLSIKLLKKIIAHLKLFIQ